jgi:P27 family predicted phage terminase small subunit
MAGNHNSGRRPQPTALKVLRGNPGKERLPEREPLPPAGEVVKPGWLSAGASVVWDEMAPVCVAMRTLTVSDTKAFATFCELQATLQMASASKDGRALLELQAKSGEDPDGPLKVVIDAVLRLERETAAGLRAYYDYFGLNPMARSKIQVPKPADEPVSKWAGVLK